MQENTGFSLDLSGIEELDPSLTEGHKVVYEREVPCELRINSGGRNPEEVGSLESVKAKVLVLGEENSPENIRLELSSENDLFFYYTHDVNEMTFKEIQNEQRIVVDFEEYLGVLVRMLNSCIKEPNTYLAVLIMNKEGSAKLEFIQNIQYKFVELLSLDFVAISEENVREQITYRYNAAKSKLAAVEARVKDIYSLVKVKNPSLLLQLQKNLSKK